MFTQFEKIVKDIDAAGGMANYQKKLKEERLNKAYCFEVAEFCIEAPHGLPYLTVLTTDGAECKFGQVDGIEEMRGNEDEHSVVLRVRNRPTDLCEATVPTPYRFKFKTHSDMSNFVKEVVVFK